MSSLARTCPGCGLQAASTTLTQKQATIEKLQRANVHLYQEHQKQQMAMSVDSSPVKRMAAELLEIQMQVASFRGGMTELQTENGLLKAQIEEELAKIRSLEQLLVVKDQDDQNLKDDIARWFPHFLEKYRHSSVIEMIESGQSLEHAEMRELYFVGKDADRIFRPIFAVSQTVTLFDEELNYQLQHETDRLKLEVQSIADSRRELEAESMYRLDVINAFKLKFQELLRPVPLFALVAPVFAA